MSKNCTKPGPSVESEGYRGMSFKSVSIICRDLVLIACLGIVPAHAQDGAQNGEWRFFGGDTGRTKYSPLDQIDKDNVADLQVAWRWRSVDGQFDLDRLTQEYPNLQVPNDVDTVQISGLKAAPLMSPGFWISRRRCLRPPPSTRRLARLSGLTTPGATRRAFRS